MRLLTLALVCAAPTAAFYESKRTQQLTPAQRPHPTAGQQPEAAKPAKPDPAAHQPKAAAKPPAPTPVQTALRAAAASEGPCADSSTFSLIRHGRIETTDGLSRPHEITHTCSDWANFACDDEQLTSSCNITAADMKVVRASCPATCGQCPSNIHGGGMFHYGGKWYQLNVPPSKPVSLLSWVGLGGKKFELFGSTFGPTLDQSNRHASLWFGRFHIEADGVTVFNAGVCHVNQTKCVTPGLKTMHAELANHHHRLHSITAVTQQGADAVSFVIDQMEKRPLIGTERPERFTVTAGGAHLEIFTAAAGKFSTEAGRARHAHLNLRLVVLPASGKGFIAQLAGQEELSQDTVSFIVPAKGANEHMDAKLLAKFDAKTLSLVAEHKEEAAATDARPVHLPGRCPGAAPKLGKTVEGCKNCVRAFGTTRTFWMEAGESCADGCCPNQLPCNGGRTEGKSCRGTAYRRENDCDKLKHHEGLLHARGAKE